MTDFVLYSPEDEAKIKALYVAVDEARALDMMGNHRIGDGGAAAEAATIANEFVAEVKARTPTLVLAALPRLAWRELGKQHPARTEPEEDAESDKAAGGFNEETFPDALLAHPGTVVKVRNSRKPATELIAALPHGKFIALYSLVYELNTGDAIDPKELPVSAPTTSSDET